ncbi:hypothetical protein JXR93_08865 [bacterium]|nr:hypothetical protein [bacterium]
MKKISIILIAFLLIIQFNSCTLDNALIVAGVNEEQSDDTFAAKEVENEPQEKKSSKKSVNPFDNYIEKQVGGYVNGQLQPQLLKIYVSFIFYYAFFNGFLVYDLSPYKEGEWTKIDVKAKDDNNEESVVYIEKAFIKREADKSEWWKVKYTNPKDNQSLIIEALFSGANDGKVLKILAKFPDSETQEIKVEGDDTYFIKPIAFSSEFNKNIIKSSFALNVGNLKVDTKKITFVEPVTDNSYEWYFSDKIPGKLVKVLYKEGEKSVQLRKESGENEARANYFSSTVVEYGKNAKFELNK